MDDIIENTRSSVLFMLTNGLINSNVRELSHMYIIDSQNTKRLRLSAKKAFPKRKAFRF